MPRRAPLLVALVALAACWPAEAPPAGPVAAGPVATGVPAGMVAVPGGRVRVGADAGDPHAESVEGPAFEADVPAFLLDRSPVTVARFRAFAEATGHGTDAERLGDAGVRAEAGRWRLVPGAMWRRPLGPDGPPAPDDHPVTQVSWNDAAAFCAWAGGRLPTEVEWEHAARGAANGRARYTWGDDPPGPEAPRANTSDADDGFARTSPVGAFGRTALGLSDVGGNVWEWTADWFRPYAERDRPFTPTAASERVQRGGSFLCHARRCHGYRVSARGHATPETALFHVGFRCAADAPAAHAPPAPADA